MTVTPQFHDPHAILQTESKNPIVLLLEVKSLIGTLLNQFLALEKILRIVAYCLRLSRFRQSNSPTALMSVEEISHLSFTMSKN